MSAPRFVTLYEVGYCHRANGRHDLTLFLRRNDLGIWSLRIQAPAPPARQARAAGQNLTA